MNKTSFTDLCFPFFFLTVQPIFLKSNVVRIRTTFVEDCYSMLPNDTKTSLDQQDEPQNI